MQWLFCIGATATTAVTTTKATTKPPTETAIASADNEVKNNFGHHAAQSPFIIIPHENSH